MGSLAQRTSADQPAGNFGGLPAPHIGLPCGFRRAAPARQRDVRCAGGVAGGWQMRMRVAPASTGGERENEGANEILILENLIFKY